MTARGRHFQSPLRGLLAAHFTEIDRVLLVVDEDLRRVYANRIGWIL